jgi:2-polyprenyl-6-methoxyphenol hydroxylase-like FAD-dependent oxidoreductase
MKILIVGCGVGGLALALSLKAAGLDDIVLFEAADEVGELGLGINLLPHAVRELTELGLGPDLAAVAVATADLRMFNAQGQQIWQEARGIGAGYHWPQYSIHRAALLHVLHRGVIARIGLKRIHTGHKATRYRLLPSSSPPGHGHRAAIHFSNGAVVSGDLVIAADGVHSAIRAQMHSNEGPVLWNGITMWRGIAEAAPFLSGQSMAMIGRFSKRAVIYPIANIVPKEGRALINMVLEVKLEQGGPLPRHDWSHTANRDEIRAHFGDMRFDWLDIAALIETAEQWYQYPMVDRNPLPSWTDGCVTLMGDAAHPMYPVGSNGCSQAIIDARTLARELALQPDIDSALHAYESARRSVTTAIVLANRQVGAEQPMELAAERAPHGFDDINDVFSQGELAQLAHRYKQVAGFDCATLNAQASRSVAG